MGETGSTHPAGSYKDSETLLDLKRLFGPHSALLSTENERRGKEKTAAHFHERYGPLTAAGLNNEFVLGESTHLDAFVRSVTPEAAEVVGNRAKRLRDVDDDFRRILHILEERRRAIQIQKLLHSVRALVHARRTTRDSSLKASPTF